LDAENRKEETMSSTNTAWLFLIAAGLLEICWVIGLKYSEGFTKLLPSLFTALTIAGSMYLLARAVQIIPIGTAYGVWVGIGALGTSLLGVFLFNEILSPIRAFFILLLFVAILGLKLTAK